MWWWVQVVWVTRARGPSVCGAQDAQGELERGRVGEGPHHPAQVQDCGLPGRKLYLGHGNQGGQGDTPSLSKVLSVAGICISM